MGSAGHRLHGQREQRVAREDGGTGAVRLPDGRAPSAQRVTVHDVVVEQGEDMDELHRDGARNTRFGGAATTCAPRTASACRTPLPWLWSAGAPPTSHRPSAYRAISAIQGCSVSIASPSAGATSSRQRRRTCGAAAGDRGAGADVAGTAEPDEPDEANEPDEACEADEAVGTVEVLGGVGAVSRCRAVEVITRPPPRRSRTSTPAPSAPVRPAAARAAVRCPPMPPTTRPVRRRFRRGRGRDGRGT